jgi:hypothetical protein
MCNYQRLVSPNLKSMGNDYELNWCVMKRKFKEIKWSLSTNLFNSFRNKPKMHSCLFCMLGVRVIVLNPTLNNILVIS